MTPQPKIPPGQAALADPFSPPKSTQHWAGRLSEGCLCKLTAPQSQQLPAPPALLFTGCCCSASLSTCHPAPAAAKLHPLSLPGSLPPQAHPTTICPNRVLTAETKEHVREREKKKKSIVILYPQLATLYPVLNKLITTGLCILCSPGNTELNSDNSRRPFRREFKEGDCISWVENWVRYKQVFHQRQGRGEGKFWQESNHSNKPEGDAGGRKSSGSAMTMRFLAWGEK